MKILFTLNHANNDDLPLRITRLGLASLRAFDEQFVPCIPFQVLNVHLWLL